MGVVVEIHKSEERIFYPLSILQFFFDLLHLSSKIIMKCFVILAIIGMCHSLPQYYLADTPEVQEAKRAFAVAYNEAVRRGGSPAPVPVAIEDPSNYSPEAEPYVHVEIPAEPYVHCDGAQCSDGAAPVVPALPAQPAAPVAPVAPVAPANYNFAGVPQGYNLAAAPANYNFAAAPANYNFAFPGYANWAGYQQYQAAAPVAPAAPVETVRSAPAAGTCHNWQGVAVPCL